MIRLLLLLLAASSFRAIPETSDAMKQLLRDMCDAIEGLQNGGALRGQVSFDDAIQIGDVLVTILDGVGMQRIVQFKNVLSGATSTITL